MSLIWRAVATRIRSFLPSRRGSSSLICTWPGSAAAMARTLFCSSSGTKLYRNIRSAGMVRNSSASMRCSRRSMKAKRYLSASLRANSRSCCSSPGSPGAGGSCSVVAIDSLLRPRHGKREDGQIQRNQNKSDDQSHKDQQNRLDEGNKGGQSQADFFLIKFRHTVQHGGKRAAGFSDLDHIKRQLRHGAAGGQRAVQGFSFAH